MRESKHWNRLTPLLGQAFFSAKEAVEVGVPVRMLSYYCDQGRLYRIAHGIYRTEGDLPMDDEQWSELAAAALTTPQGVICLISALCIYELTDEVMRQHWIAVPHAQRAARRPGARIVRMRNIELGKTTVEIAGRSIQIFDKERTIVDSFRLLSLETAVTALRYYLTPSENHRPDVQRLLAYARKLHVNLLPYIHALTA